MSIQNIRDNTQGFLSKFIIGVIVITFALWGVDAIVGFTSSDSDTVAEVNGTKITETDLNRAVYILRNQVLAEMGEDANLDLIDEDLLTRQALDNLVERAVLVSDAEKNNLLISDNTLNSAIVTNTAFQGADGAFNADIYQAQIRNIGLTPLSYKQELAYDLVLRQARLGLAASEFVTPLELDQLAQLDKQTRSFDFVIIPAEDFMDKAVVSEEDALDWYQDNQDNYLSEELISVDYLELRQSDFTDLVTVAEEDLQLAYQQAVESHQAEEERKASHILLTLDDRDLDEAIQEAQELKARLDAGESFADLAKEYSDDFGSAESGGDLGYLTKAIYEGPFADALYSLEVGQVTDPVVSDFGVHLIELTDVRSTEMADFDSMRAELEEQVKLEKAEGLFLEALETLENEAFSSYDLQGPAEMLSLPIQTSPLFGRSGGEGIAVNSQVVDAAFSDSVLIEGNNSEVVSIDQTHVVVLHKKTYQPAELLSFDQVREQIVSQLSAQQASAIAAEAGRQVEEKLGEGVELNVALNGAAYQWQSEENVSRGDSLINADALQAAFEMAKPGDQPTVSGQVLDSGDYLVMRLNAVSSPASGYSDDEKNSVMSLLVNQRANQAFNEYLADLTEKADINR